MLNEFGVLQKIVSIADRIDELGFTKQASLVDKVIVKLCQELSLEENETTPSIPDVKLDDFIYTPFYNHYGAVTDENGRIFITSLKDLANIIGMVTEKSMLYQIKVDDTDAWLYKLSEHKDIFDTWKDTFWKQEMKVRDNIFDMNSDLQEIKRVFKNYVVFNAKQSGKKAVEFIDDGEVVIFDQPWVTVLELLAKNKDKFFDKEKGVQQSQYTVAKGPKIKKKKQPSNKYVKKPDILRQSVNKFMTAKATQSIISKTADMPSQERVALNKELFEIVMAVSKSTEGGVELGKSVYQYLHENGVPIEFAGSITDTIKTLETNFKTLELVDNKGLVASSPEHIMANGLFNPSNFVNTKTDLALEGAKTGNMLMYLLGINDSSIAITSDLSSSSAQVVRMDFEDALAVKYKNADEFLFSKFEPKGYAGKDVDKIVKTEIGNEKTMCSIDVTNICPKRLKCKTCKYCYIESHRDVDCNAKKLIIHRGYEGQIRTFKPDVIKALNKMGGLRVFNASDYMPSNFAVLKDMFDDAYAVGLFIKVITKVPEFIEDFVNHPAIKIINVSVDKTGDGMPINKARELKQKYGDKVKVRCAAMNPLEIVEFLSMKYKSQDGEEKDLVDVVTAYHGYTKIHKDSLESRGYNKEHLKKIQKKNPEEFQMILDGLKHSSLVWTDMVPYRGDFDLFLRHCEGRLGEVPDKKIEQHVDQSGRESKSKKLLVWEKLLRQNKGKSKKEIMVLWKAKENERLQLFMEETRGLLGGMKVEGKRGAKDVNVDVDVFDAFLNNIQKIKSKLCCFTGECVSCKNHCGFGESINNFEGAINFNGWTPEQEKNYVKWLEIKARLETQVTSRVKVTLDAERQRLERLSYIANIINVQTRWQQEVDNQNVNISKVRSILKSGGKVPKELADLAYVKPYMREHKAGRFKYKEWSKYES